MQTSAQPQQPDPPSLALVLSTCAYYQLIHTLDAILPPPLADTPEARQARTNAAVDRVAGMLPTNANEAGLAAQCVAASAQAEDVMRLIRVHADDIKIVMRLNAQYTAMIRAAQGAHTHLTRAQALRHKREASNLTADTDAWTLHIATETMRGALKLGLLPASAPSAPAKTEPPPAPDAHTVAAAEGRPAQAATPTPVVAGAAPVLAATAPPAAATARLALARLDALTPVSAAVVACLPAQATSNPAGAAPQRARAAPRRLRGVATLAAADDPARDMAAEADRYAVIYPHRAREIRRYRGLPPHCSFGPPDDDLLHAIVTGTSPILCALDEMHAIAQ